MIPGTDFDFGGGRVYTIPPLSLGALEGLQKRLGNLSTGNPGDASNISTVLDATHAALKRNYPDITRDEVADLIDLGNMSEVITAVMNIAGLQRRVSAPGEPTPHSAPPQAG